MIPITKPTLPKYEELESELKEIFSSGMITNHTYVKQLEEKIQTHLGVKHAIAVSSCTSGLMLVMKALNLKGEVIIPSFTFSASGHAVMWNNLTPKFVDINPETFTVDPQKIKEAINENTSAILAVHLFGCPANVEELQNIAKEHNLKLIYDSAHAFGAKVSSTYVGNFGDAEVFSCSPTKLMVTGEGGIVTTNDDLLAKKIKMGRVYGDPGDYNCEFTGLSARMSEVNALLGSKSINLLETNIAKRLELVNTYKTILSIPGISFQKIPSNCKSTFKDFSILIDPTVFGLNRDQLHTLLLAKGIQTKKYFFPPLHEQTAYNDFAHIGNTLPNTINISQNILSLPLYSHMSKEEVTLICNKIIDCKNNNKREL